MATRSLCWTHYQRRRRNGDVGVPGPVVAPDIWSRIDRSGGPSVCWPWLGALCASGYGHVSRPRETKQTFIHRYVFELMHGSIPDHMTVDHLCFNTLCCNPAHLQIVTLRENLRRRRGVKRRSQSRRCCEHRINGEIPEGLLYVAPGGSRYCRPCQNRSAVAWQRARRTEAQSLRRGHSAENP